MTAGDLSIEPVARRLLGDPNRALSTKAELRYGRKGSLAVDLAKDTWFDHEAGEGGGVLDLICRENGGSHREARDWLRDELGLGGNGETLRTLKGDPGSHAATRKSDRRAEGNRRYALETWNASSDADRTEVETYLRGRSITLPIPPALRFHSNLKHTDTGLYFPAMVAGVQASDGTTIAIHRTYLLPGGRGKAQVNRPKMALGKLDDGAVRLAPAEKALGLAEGIETALSAMQLFEIPVWAVLSCGRFASVTIPDDVIEVQLFADRGDEGEQAAQQAKDHFLNTGKRVAIRRPPQDCGDWNDALPKWCERPVEAWEF